MEPSGVITAIIIGLVIGALGRLIVPGRQAIGMILTIVLGLVGAFVGAYLGDQFTDSFWIILLVQVAIAAILVALAGAATRGGSRD